MKRIKIVLLSLFVASTAFAQKTQEQMAGVYHAYPAPAENGALAAPEGYKPVYISHYGRHGSRWLTNDDRYLWVMEKFADKSNLTKDGKKVEKLLQKVWKNAKGNGGQLSPLGARQHAGIAKRMLAKFPEVFTPNATVEARSSVVNRCKKSMNAFCAELPVKFPQITDSADMKWIAYSSPEEEKLIAETHPGTWATPDRLISSLFKDPSKVKEPMKVMSELYTIATDMQDVELKVDLYQFFQEEEMRALYEQNNERMWIDNGQSPDNYGIPQRSALSLWENIEAEAEKALANNEHGADLRFGHDTSLYRLLALMGITSLSDERVDNMDEIVPMAANFQMIFYSNGKNIIVQMLHNEKPVKLFRLVDQNGFYPWKQVKNYVHKRINAAHKLGILADINTMVGTHYAVTNSVGKYGKGSEEHGQTIPAVLEPFGMNFWTPQTEDTETKCVAPYYYKSNKLQGFRASHWLNGGCTQDYGSFTLMPLMDNLRLSPEARASRFSHADEVSHPDYYSVVLPDEHLKAEMTGMSHSAFFRFKYQKEGRAYFVINPNSDEHEGWVKVDTARNIVYGCNPVHRIYQGWGEKAGFSGYFVVAFQDQIADWGIEQNDSTATAWVAIDVQKNDELLVKAATSFVDMKGAWNNMEQEMPHWEFYDTRCRVAESWVKRLSRVDVEDKDTAAVRKFYGALYRTSFLPRAFSDKDGRFPSFAGGDSIMQNSYGKIGGKQVYRRMYMDYSLWDTYRAQAPLNAIIEPQHSGMIANLVDMYDQGGWLPIFPAWNSYTAAMIGDHATAAISDAIVKGLRNIKVEKAYEAMRKNAFESPKTDEEYKNGMGRRALKSYMKYGYIPMEDHVNEAFHTEEQVSRTLEYAYDDFALAQVAKLLGKTEDYNILMKRAANWKNVFNPRTRWADGRYQNGRWLNNKDSVNRVPFITEGAVCHYSFYVPQDVPGLIKVMGGKQSFNNRLDWLFGSLLNSRPSSVLISPPSEGSGEASGEAFYWHGNEPSHQIPYLYVYGGEAWKTQQVVRNILDTEYQDVAGGLSGNDDAGQMSAWYVFSSLGFYPVCPATPYYIIGTPTFEKARIADLVIEAENVSRDNCFIQSATFNGKDYPYAYITHDMLENGGVLRFVMGNKPNKAWGIAPENVQ